MHCNTVIKKTASLEAGDITQLMEYVPSLLHEAVSSVLETDEPGVETHI